MLRTNFIRNIPRPKKDYSHLLKITGFNNYTDEVLARLNEMGYDVRKEKDRDRIIWRINDKYHRENGPAIEFKKGDKYWCINDKYHREDGPAIEAPNGDRYWYINDRECTEEKYNKSTAEEKRVKL